MCLFTAVCSPCLQVTIPHKVRSALPTIAFVAVRLCPVCSEAVRMKLGRSVFSFPEEKLLTRNHVRKRPRLIESWDARRTALPQELLAIQPNCSDGAWGTGIFYQTSLVFRYAISHSPIPYAQHHPGAQLQTVGGVD